MACSFREFPGVEDNAFVVMGVVVDTDGDDLEQADLASITYSVCNTATGDETANGSLTISSVIFDTRQIISLWDEDSEGFNFKCVIPPAAFPDGDVLYQVEFTFTPNSGYPIKDGVQVRTRSLYGS